mmetsp:Transcript_110759/g.309820  ORF Transcript_110759/g.309820 Transcript_110759/m.309820 type:complete len:243 (+) Transcript_110759:337-1065(+)
MADHLKDVRVAQTLQYHVLLHHALPLLQDALHRHEQPGGSDLCLEHLPERARAKPPLHDETPVVKARGQKACGRAAAGGGQGHHRPHAPVPRERGGVGRLGQGEGHDGRDQLRRALQRLGRRRAAAAELRGRRGVRGLVAEGAGHRLLCKLLGAVGRVRAAWNLQGQEVVEGRGQHLPIEQLPRVFVETGVSAIGVAGEKLDHLAVQFPGHLVAVGHDSRPHLLYALPDLGYANAVVALTEN